MFIGGQLRLPAESGGSAGTKVFLTVAIPIFFGATGMDVVVLLASSAEATG